MKGTQKGGAKVVSHDSSRADRVKASLTVVAVGRRQSTIDLDPVYEVDLVLLRPGLPAQPLATSLRVPIGRMGAFGAGSEVPVELSPSDPSVFDVEWALLQPSRSPPIE
jgi:hypothetical protein